MGKYQDNFDFINFKNGHRGVQLQLNYCTLFLKKCYIHVVRTPLLMFSDVSVFADYVGLWRFN